MPDAFRVCGTMCKVKKKHNLFGGDSQLSSQNAMTKVRLLYLIGNHRKQENIFKKLSQKIVK